MKSPPAPCLLTLVCLPAGMPPWATPLKIPAQTAYSVPDASALRIRDNRSIPLWQDSSPSAVWIGRFATNWFRCGLMLLFAWAGTWNLLAKTSAEVSHARFSPDGRQVLVMVPGDTGRVVLRPVELTLPDGRRVALHEAFPKSGVYNPATLQPVWQVEWFSPADHLSWSDDFRRVVRLNIHALDPHASWALAFFRDGQPVREYDSAQLLTTLRSAPFFEFTSMDWHLVWYDEFEMLGDRLVFSTARRGFWSGRERWLDLGYQENYSFDLTTGEVLSLEIRGRARLAAIAAGLLALLLVLPVGIWLKRRRDRSVSA